MRKYKKGFTLVELIVVIVIIAILSVVMIPTLTKYIDRANLSKDQQTTETLNTYLENNLLLFYDMEINSRDDVIKLLKADDPNKELNLATKSKGYYLWFDIENRKIILDTYENMDKKSQMANLSARNSDRSCLSEFFKGYYFLDEGDSSLYKVIEIIDILKDNKKNKDKSSDEVALELIKALKNVKSDGFVKAYEAYTEYLNGLKIDIDDTTKFEIKVTDVGFEINIEIKVLECNHEKTKVIYGYAPTCTEKGKTDGVKCTLCGDIREDQQDIPALGHTEVIDDAVSPTCIATGLTEGKHCSVCHDVLVAQEVVAALGHTEVIDYATAPTCTETGLTEGKHCSVCHDVLVAQEVVAALGHNEKTHTKVEPTCTEIGYEEGVYCTVCKTYLSGHEEIEALGHTLVIDAYKAATCTEPGLTEGKHCSVCEKVLVAQEKIEALGHNYSEHKANNNGTHTLVCSNNQNHTVIENCYGGEATCLSKAVCSLCSKEYGELAGHTYEDVLTFDNTNHWYKATCSHDTEKKGLEAHKYTSEVTAPTCTEKGYTTYTCECGYSYKDNYVNALGHKPGAEWITTETHHYHNCENCGEKVDEASHIKDHDKATEEYGIKCKICNYQIAEQLEHTHTIQETKDAKAPTCTENGNIKYYACRCGKLFSDESLTIEVTNEQIINPALGHDKVSHEAKEATCTEKGHKAYETCSRCDYTTYEEIPALGHNKVQHEAKEATCTEKGHKAYETCSRCDYTTYEETPALGHDEVEHDAKEATCTEKGHKAYVTCNRCDYTTYQETAALGHIEVIDQKVEPTCTTTGLTEGKRCSRCDTVFIAQTEIAAKGHSATTTDNITYTCSCGLYYVAKDQAGVYYTSLEEAINKNLNVPNSVIYLIGNYEVSADTTELTIPSTMTLILVSIKDTSTTVGSINYSWERGTAAPYSESKVLVDEKSEYIQYRLTLHKNLVLNVEGAIIIQGVMGVKVQGLSGHTSGIHSQIINNGLINVRGSAKLDVRGYIKGSGTIEAFNGCSIYSPFVVHDFRGGSSTAVTYGSEVCPFNQIELPNIQCDLKINTGTTYNGYAHLWANDKHNASIATIYGKSNALINLTSGYILKEYNNGITSLFINGTAALGSLLLTVDATIAKVNVSTESVFFPLSWRYSIIVETGTCTVNYPVKVMPGAKIVVEKDATLSIGTNGRVNIYDSYIDNANLAPYPNKEAGSVIIKGKLISAGIIGGKINGEDGAYLDVANIDYVTSKEGNGLGVPAKDILAAYTLGGGLKGLAKYLKQEVVSKVKLKGVLPYNDNAVEFNLAGKYVYNNGAWIRLGEHNIIFDCTGGSAISNITFNISYSEGVLSSGLSLPDDINEIYKPTREGYIFSGWYFDENCTKSASSSQIVTNTTLYARWVGNKYNITYEVNGGTIAGNYATYHVYGSTTILPTPEKSGYKFAGWYSSPDLNTNGDTAIYTIYPTDYLADFTLYARWELENYTSYTVEFFVDGQLCASDQVEEGKSAKIPEQPTKEGYHFAGWFDEEGKQYDSETIITSSVILIAKWKWRVTFNGNGGSASSGSMNYQEEDIGSSLKLSPNTFTRSGYKFQGWSTSSSSKTAEYADEATININKNVTLYAVWKQESSGGCFASGTLITLADGSTKKIEDLLETDELLVFDHENGVYTTAPIIFIENDGMNYYNVITLKFDNGTTSRIIYEHAFFDLTLNKYVYITEENYTNYVGHSFAVYDEELKTYNTTVLVESSLEEEYTGCYSLVTVYHMNNFIDGLFSFPGGIDGLFNYFEYDESLKYDKEIMESDILEYGLYTYDDFKDYIPYEVYEYIFPTKYFKVAVGKGMITFDEIVSLIEKYLVGHGII